MERINPRLAKALERLSLYETFRCECESIINAFNLGVITREEMLKKFAFSNDKLNTGLQQ